MRLLKRTLSAFLAFVMVFTMLPLQVWASETQQSANDSVNFGSIVADGADDDRALEEVGNDVDTYIFEVDGEKVSTQYVKAGEEVHEPAAPAKEGQKFMGWFDAKDNAFDASKVLTSMPNGTTYTYTAKYQQLYYVFFMDGTGDDAAVVYTQEGTPGALIKTDVTFDAGLDKGVAGWYYDKTYSRPVGANDLIGNENITLYPKIEGGHWIHFDTDGGEPIPSVFVKPSERPEAPDTPKREGFDFLHWVDENGDKFEFGNELTKSVTLKAKWQGNEVNYSVFYWVENADNDDYSLVNRETLTGIAGDVAVNDNFQLRLPEGYSDQNLAKAVTLNTEKTGAEKEKTIAGDGSTIVNVYYDREVYTIYFYKRGSQKVPTCGLEEHVHNRHTCGEPQWTILGPHYPNCDKVSHTHNAWCYWGSSLEIDKKIEAKYGAFIGKQWPNNSKGGTNWSTVSSGGFPMQSNIQTMPFDGAAFYEPSGGNQTQPNKQTAYYYTEVLNGSQGTKYVGGKWYARHHEDTIYHDGGLKVSEEDRYPIQGFTLNKEESSKPGSGGWWGDSGDNYHNAEFYYTRNSYELSLVNTLNGGSHLLQYQQPLAGYLEDPEKPSNLNENFNFQGWYRDENFTEEFVYDGETTMPADSLTLYAKWAAEPVEVKVHLGMGPNSRTETITVPYGEKIPQELLPVIVGAPADHGWATYEQGKYLAFNLDRPLYADIEIFPYWISTDSFHVIYDLGEDVEGSVTDPNAYRSTAHAEVLGIGEDVEKPNGKIFLGWKQEGDKTLYRPGMKIQIQNANVTLTAEWGDVAQKTTLTYHANDGTETKRIYNDLMNNQDVTLKSAESLKFTNTGYEFLGWARAANAETPDFEAGQTIRVNNDDPDGNILYAVWKQISLPGTAITVQVLMDGKLVNAADYVDLTVAGTTDNFSSKVNGQTYTVTFNYEKFNCADFNVTLKNVPEGYNKSVDSSSKTTTAADGETRTYSDKPIENGWTLDNVPGGATVTVSLNTQKFTVKYEVSPAEGGTVSRDNETVSYGENAGGSTATANEDYYFVGWKDDKGQQVSANATFGPNNVTADATYTAVFAKKENIEVTITGNYTKETYNGEKYTANGYTVSIPEGSGYTEDGIVFNGEDTAFRTNAGITYMGLKASQFTNKNEKYNVTFKVEDGYVQINPAEVTVEIKGHSDSKPYTGGKQKVEGYDVKIAEGSLYKEEYFTFTGSAVAEGTDVNTYPMGLKADQFVNKNDNFEVTFDVKDGALEITAIEDAVVVNIVGNHVIAPYDGQGHEAEGYNVKIDGSTLYGENDFTFSGNKHASRTDAGITYMGLKAEDFQNTNKNFTNVTFSVAEGADGYVQINPAKVTVEIKGHSDSKPYTGSKQKVEGYDVKIAEGSLYKEEYFTFTGSAVAEGTDVNTYPMGLKADQFVNKNDNFKVMFDVKDGALEITAIETEVVVTISGYTRTETYNGEEYRVGGYEASSSNELYTVEDFSYVVDQAELTIAQTNAGTYKMGLTAEDFENTNKNFTKVKFVVAQDGSLTILPKPISIEVADGVKTYGETELEITVTADGLVNENDLGEITYERKSESENAGIYTDELWPVYTPNPNYTVTEMPGTLTINKRPIVLTSYGDTKTYDGKALTKPEVEIGDVKFVDGHVEKVEAIGTQTLVGESVNAIEITWADKTVAGNYKIDKTEGTLTVTAPENLNDYVVKTHEGQNFKVGDTVTFKITVTNIYAVKATVKLEEMAGMFFGENQTTLEDVLEPGQTKTYTATRLLTEQDFENDGVSNTVEVTLDLEKDGEPEILGTDTDEVPLESKPDMSVDKTVLEPKESYRVGDTIRYQITVTNTGNVPLHDLELTDVMNADGKVTFPAGTVLTRETLNVGDSWIVTCSYVVRAADEGKTISNTAKVISRDDDGNPNKDGEDTTPGESVQKRYSLTIHYRNAAGNAVAGSYSARYHVGDSFKIDSPIVAGYYDPQIRSISSGANGMPAQDLEYVVIYTAIPAPVDPEGPNPGPNVPDDDDDDDDTPPVPDPEQEQPPQPQDFEIDPDDYTLTEVEDNETPLANLNLEGHTCCILHLLLMLAAMVVLGFDTKSRKKHQARIFELKKMLAMEEDHSDDPEQP